MASPSETNTYYNHDELKPSTSSSLNKNWMETISDSVKIADMSIPGTHDSLSLFGGDLAETQVWSITRQLEVGVRFFDFRFLPARDSAGNEYLEAFHGVID
jgi:1-phosphatidylinositol phosphodiesterase